MKLANNESALVFTAEAKIRDRNSFYLVKKKTPILFMLHFPYTSSHCGFIQIALKIEVKQEKKLHFS